MTAHLFQTKVYFTEANRAHNICRSQWVVAYGATRTVATPKAMRKTYALWNRWDLFSVELEYHGKIEVAS